MRLVELTLRFRDCPDWFRCTFVPNTEFLLTVDDMPPDKINVSCTEETHITFPYESGNYFVVQESYEVAVDKINAAINAGE